MESGSDIFPSPVVSVNVPDSPALGDDSVNVSGASYSDWHTSPPDEYTLVNLEPNNILSNDSNDHFVRQSCRNRKPPAWWSDYQVHNVHTTVVGSSAKYSMNNFLSTGSFSTKHVAFFSKLVQNKEPKTFIQVVQDSRWIEAMNKELDALESNNTWILVPLPSGKQTIGCRWVFKIKYLANGEVDRFKARLVAKGYTQEPGVDFHDTFAPVAKGVTVKSVIAVAASIYLPLFQLDINNAFLHGDLSEEIYMDLP